MQTYGDLHAHEILLRLEFEPRSTSPGAADLYILTGVTQWDGKAVRG